MSRTSVYSFGEDSPLKFEIPDKLAKQYNSAAEEYFKALRRFVQKHGRTWNSIQEPGVRIRWNQTQRKAWNEIARLWERNNVEQGPFHANDIMDDFLVKNAVSTVARASGKFGRVLSLAVAGGVLYGLLNRRKA